MRIYLRKRRLCESRAAVRTDIPSGGSPEFVMLQEFLYVQVSFCGFAQNIGRLLCLLSCFR